MYKKEIQRYLLRQYLKLTLLLIFIVFFIYLLNEYAPKSSLFNFSVSPKLITLITGITGVIVGTLLTNYYNARRERQKNKRSLITEFINLTYEINVHLTKIQKTLLTDQKEMVNEIELLNLKIYKELQTFNINCWDVFNSLLIKAAISRFLESYTIITDQVLFKKPIDNRLLKTSVLWIEKQASEIIPLLMENASIPTKTKVGLIFVGFRKVTPLNREKLKFDVGKPPWEPHIIFDLDKAPNEEIAKKIYDQNIKKIASLKCDEHGFAPHLIISGRSIDGEIRIGIMACCDKLLQETQQCI